MAHASRNTFSARFLDIMRTRFHSRAEVRMKTPISPLWFVAMAVILLCLGVGRTGVLAQTNAEPAAPRTAELSEEDLIKLNLHLQAELHAAQQAIERNRQEAQEAARAQAAAITEKLNGIQQALDAERQRRQDEAQRTTRTLLWVAAMFGGVGLLAMALTAVFQYRAMSRMTEIATSHAQLPAPAPHALLPAETAGLPGRAVEVSNQRLLSVIDRLERRVFELEHTAAHPLPAHATGHEGPVIDSAPGGASGPHAARIQMLLGKGQSLLNADKADEARACYDEILSLEANHPEALVKKGAALERLKQDEEALRCYDRAIAADGSLTIAYLYKGGVYNRLERYNEALECYEQALRAQGGAN
jgi:tetratricopeptide (TPR) repeat protein